MALITSVIVSGITNLSDARYCAGMGVDMLGFGFEEKHPAYVSPAVFKEISGWVAGVKMVGEFASSDSETINELANEYNLDLVQLEKVYLLDEIEQIEKPVIQKLLINKDTYESEMQEMMELYKPHVAAFLLHSTDFNSIDQTNIKLLKNLAKKFPVFIGFGLDNNNINQILKEVKPAGIGLVGGEEIRPGFKNFDALQDVLEVLED
ncbi:MAG: hypothetical protein LPK19_12895 [Hymenobacteraceae bacterium]|nr:hypothetical protein [Hymenobacteraceae bacterium]MDX5397119.1 hypothetical protein [Hymenobacteraceae bacterium]MDX5513197.1 hypothetical protein [Hymenobacteraceae bacterium]